MKLSSHRAQYFRTNFPPKIFLEYQAKITVKLQVEKEYTMELGKIYLTKGMAIPEISHTNRLCEIYIIKSRVLCPAWEATMHGEHVKTGLYL